MTREFSTIHQTPFYQFRLHFHRIAGYSVFSFMSFFTERELPLPRLWLGV